MHQCLHSHPKNRYDAIILTLIEGDATCFILQHECFLPFYKFMKTFQVTVLANDPQFISTNYFQTGNGHQSMTHRKYMLDSLLGISLRRNNLPNTTTTSIVMGHDEQEQVQEQVEDHCQNGQVAAAGLEFGDTYQADA